MTAIRSVRAAEGKFVQVANAAAQDRRLSLRARGVLLFMLSLPPEKHFTAKWLEAQVPEGREAIRSALRELEDCGYLRRERKHGAGGLWAWEQVISDAPLAEAGGSPCDGNPYDGKPSDGNPSHKELKTQQPQDVSQEMAQERASRRAHASGERATRKVGEVVRDIREAVALVHGQREADELYDDDALGLYFTYANPKKPVRDLVAYMVKILGDVDHVDALISNSTPVCTACVQYESDCKCPQSSAA